MLCDLCNNIFSGREGVYSGGAYPKQHKNIQSFCRSVEQKCYVCTKLWNRFTQRYQGDLEVFKKNFRDTWYVLKRDKDVHQRDGSHQLTIFLEKNHDLEHMDFSAWENMTFCVSAGRHGTLCQELLARCTSVLLTSLDFNHLASSDEIATSTASEASWNLVTQWIATCTSDHVRCNNSVKDHDFLPTRLIDLGPSGSESKLYLVHTSTFSAREGYVSLSHCWGSFRVLKLTNATRKELEAGFDVSILPNTYRDAIAVVRRLGVRYLWIDSLCIFQDSADDWRKEASMMEDVYQNSLCNIASTGANNAEESMFVERDPVMVQPCMITTDWSVFASNMGIVVEQEIWEAGVSDAPLNRRGWVIQERLLAPRVLHFGKEQLFWECHELDACETFPRGVPPMFPEYLTTRFKGLDPDIDGERLRKQAERRVPDLDHNLRPYFVWHQILSAYRKCDLSNSEDKLIAISGIVKVMQKQLDGDEYLAGLWRRHLVPELLWYCVGTHMGGRKIIPKRPLQYRAPSWSWASIDGRGVQISPTHGDHLVSILDAHVTPVTTDVTGQIKDGYIRLRGCLVRVLIEGNNKIRVNGETLGLESQVYLDVPLESIVGLVYALPVLRRMSGGTLWIDGLFLQSTGKRQGEYYRQGLWWAERRSSHHFEAPDTEMHYRPELYEEGGGRTIVMV
jgi:hypothetical protein